MEQRRISALFVIFCICLSRVQNADVSITIQKSSWKVTVEFTQDRFIEFYECLCEGRNNTCSAYYDYSEYVTYIEKIDGRIDVGNSCKFYKCRHSSRYPRLRCSQQFSPSCYSSDKYQALRYRNSSCSSTQCVVFIWDDFEIVDYTELSNIIISCQNCECLRTVTSTTSTARTSTTRRTTTRKTSTSRTRQTTARTRASTAVTTTTTTAVITVAARTTTEKEKFQSASTTEKNITSSKAASTSDDNTDNIPVIIGVIIPLVLLLIVVIIVVFLWRRKRSHKTPATPADVHVYANSAMLPVTAKKTEMRPTITESNQHFPGEYSKCAVNKTIYENCTRHIINDIANNEETERSSQSTPEYSKAEPLENNIKNTNSANRVEQNKVNVNENRTYPSNSGIILIENTMDETHDDPIYTVATLTCSNNSKDTIFSHGVATTSSAPHERNDEQLSTAQTTGPPDTRYNSPGHKYLKASKLSSFSGYQNIDLTVHSHLNNGTENTNVPMNSEHVYEHSVTHYNTQASLPSCWSTNEDDEYSIAGNLQILNNTSDTSKFAHDYAILGEERRNIVNPYNILMSENDVQCSQQEQIQSSNREIPTDQDNPYSMAYSLQN